MLAILRSGLWAEPARLRLYARLLLLIGALALTGLVATAHNNRDALGRPLGTDFSQVWVAGVEVLEGHAAAPFALQTHAARQRELFGADADIYGWHYPPYFLSVAALFALLPYLAALALWQLSTLPLYVGTVVAILKHRGMATRDIVLGALAFPAVFVNLGHGHNGFLTAALLGGGLLSLDKRPWLAGALFGCLVYKPQFALALPLALLAGGYWRVILSACLSVAVLTLGTWAAFGPEVWIAFRDNLGMTQLVLEQGAPGFEKIQSIFAAIRLSGGSIMQAYAAQSIVTALVLAVLCWMWHAHIDLRLRAAALLTAALLTTPYCLDYDMMVLGPALAFAFSYAFEKGFIPWEKTLLAAVWVAPLISRQIAGATGIPLGFCLMVAFFALLTMRALQERQPATLFSPREKIEAPNTIS